MNELISQKINLRKILSHKRDLIKKNSTVEFDVKIFDKLNKYINFKEILHIASFISIRSEISTHQLNKTLMDLGKTLSFPVIRSGSKELIFIKSNLNNNFKLGKYNSPEPSKENQETLPQLFFVPCLGFDMNGYRLGYGGGFYDRLINNININKKVLKIGLAYSKQKINTVPVNKYDKKLDFIVTEKYIL